MDIDLLNGLNPDVVLFVGDLGDSDIPTVKSIKSLSLPFKVILGNHDRGSDLTGGNLKGQLDLLQGSECSWRFSDIPGLPVSIVGARPCSAGGGYFLSPQMKSVFGDIPLEESVRRIVLAAQQTPTLYPLILLAHSGPTGLGSDKRSPCGRDWKVPSIDWGDKDLEIAIDEIQKFRTVDLVVFGHMHHQLKRGSGFRNTFVLDEKRSTAYLNSACVPRKVLDHDGVHLIHFSWVEFRNLKLSHVSHRWYRPDRSIAYIDTLFDTDNN